MRPVWLHILVVIKLSDRKGGFYLALALVGTERSHLATEVFRVTKATTYSGFWTSFSQQSIHSTSEYLLQIVGLLHELQTLPLEVMGNEREVMIEQPRDTRHKGFLLDFWNIKNPGPGIKPLVVPMLIQSSLPSMLIFQRISLSVVPQAIRKWWPCHLQTGFPRDVLYDTLERKLPQPQITVGGSWKNLFLRSNAFSGTEKAV